MRRPSLALSLLLALLAAVPACEGGPAFPADLRTAVEEALRDELAVEVSWHERIPLPRNAWYAPRKRWRADVLLEHLVTLASAAPASTRVLGLTTRDISTTKGERHDWGVFGLGYMPGQAAVISSHRLRRGAKDREQLRFRLASTAVHEVGHTFGLDHCPEARCPMQDAEGGIENTDTSTATSGPSAAPSWRASTRSAARPEPAAANRAGLALAWRRSWRLAYFEDAQ